MKIHFIGIGGIGVSALAKYYLKKGWEVSGCDLASSEITDQLKSMGIAVRIGKPDISCVPENADRVVYSPAVPEGNIERKKKKAQSYPEALGELTRTHYTV
ncbi:MAG: UDP-N-acetylmuramate--L-alanine ligase, partial [Candidatus Colwellbacteria bacterium]|nr:UDP-N-acetylmuramate--L-alanine ligase [Candidatus Colwellbacteria bacterium]